MLFVPLCFGFVSKDWIFEPNHEYVRDRRISEKGVSFMALDYIELVAIYLMEYREAHHFTLV
jgi:hypothetical protein